MAVEEESKVCAAWGDAGLTFPDEVGLSSCMSVVENVWKL
jgi:hypothetical protein